MYPSVDNEVWQLSRPYVLSLCSSVFRNKALVWLPLRSQAKRCQRPAPSKKEANNRARARSLASPGQTSWSSFLFSLDRLERLWDGVA